MRRLGGWFALRRMAQRECLACAMNAFHGSDTDSAAPLPTTSRQCCVCVCVCVCVFMAVCVFVCARALGARAHGH
jgi:hypothetical protein